MHPREAPEQAQSRREAEPGLGHDHGGSWPSQAAGPAQAGPVVRLSPRRAFATTSGPVLGPHPSGRGGQGRWRVFRRLPGRTPGLPNAISPVPTPAPLAAPARVHWIASQALVLLVLLGLAGAGAAAQERAGIEELLRSARLWQSLDRPDAARQVLLKVLAVQADEPQALLLLGELELRSGRSAEAQRHLARLRTNPAAADAARELQQLTRLYTQDKAQLAQLRLLRRGGNNTQALALARTLFPDGEPPGDLAAEFAPLLAGTPQGWDTMRRLLEARVAHGSGPRDRLALYELLAQRDQTLAQALKGYADLAGGVEVEAARVSQAWRRALERLPAGTAARAERQRYAQRFPPVAAPPEATASTPPATAAAPPVAAGGAAGRAPGRTSDRTQDRTSNQTPDHTPDGTRVARERVAPSADSAFWEAFRRARALRDEGLIEDAVRMAVQANALLPREAEGVLLLADLRLRQGRAPEAEALYQALAARELANGRAWGGLLGIRLRDGRAELALKQAAALAGTKGIDMADVLDAGALREAADTSLARRQAGPALRLLESGVALRPADAWLRHDLARLYTRLRLPTLAQAVMDEGLALRPNDAPMRHAAALVAAGADREDAAISIIEALPVHERNDGMRKRCSACAATRCGAPPLRPRPRAGWTRRTGCARKRWPMRVPTRSSACARPKRLLTPKMARLPKRCCPHCLRTQAGANPSRSGCSICSASLQLRASTRCSNRVARATPRSNRVPPPTP
jgi:cellulose synthase operon protein C